MTTPPCSPHPQEWPQPDEQAIVDDDVVIVVQINGRRAGEVQVAAVDAKDKEVQYNTDGTACTKHCSHHALLITDCHQAHHRVQHRTGVTCQTHTHIVACTSLTSLLSFVPTRLP